MNRKFLAIVAVLAFPMANFGQPVPSGDPSPRDNANTPFRPAPASALSVIQFDPNQLGLRRADKRWQLWAGRQLLKEVGFQERDALEAWRLVRDLHFNQFATVAGANPPFEFWLNDSETSAGGLVVKNVISFSNQALRVEQIAGAWVIRDDHQLLYNFGLRQEAAQQALALMKKYKFNELGFVGIPNPIMTYLMADPRQHVEQVRKGPDAMEMISKVSHESLMLPKIGYVGTRTAIEPRRLELARPENDWTLIYGKDVLARFGNNATLAREGLRALQDSRVTELCFIGASQFPLFLTYGQAPRSVGFNFNNVRFHPERLTAQQINNVWCLADGPLIIFEFGDKQADAELMLKVIQHFQFDQMCPIGDMTRGGGFRYLTRSR